MSAAPSDPTLEQRKQQLMEEAARYQALVEHIPAIVYLDLPQEDETLYVSPQLEQILGVTPQRYVEEEDDLWVAMLHPDDRDRVLREYEGFLERGGPDIGDYRMVRPDGRIVWIRDRSKPVRDEHGRVVIEQGVMFDITEFKEAEATREREVRLLTRVEEIGRDFTELVMREAGIRAILGRLSDIARNPVVLEDAAHQLVEFTAHDTPVDEVLATWETHSRTGHEDRAGVGGARIEEGDPVCAWVPIALRDGAWGRLHLLEIEEPSDEVDLLALDRAAASIGLSLLLQRDAANRAERAGSAFVADLAADRYGSAAEILQRARALGTDLSRRSLGALAVQPRDALPAERERQQLRWNLLEETRAAAATEGAACLAALEGDQVLAVIGARHDDIREALDRIGSEALQRIEDRFGIAAVAGASAAEGPADLGRSLQQAGEAALYGGRTGGGVHHFSDLGIHHLLAQLSEGPALARFVESELAPLLTHDARSSSPLVPTLRVYLANGGRKSPSARDLHIERRSLYHRLARIEKLLGRKLDDAETRVKLDVAVRGLDLLRARSRT
ncbi:MAG: PAS domain-containing protein [Actinomycetota bacterium]